MREEEGEREEKRGREGWREGGRDGGEGGMEGEREERKERSITTNKKKTKTKMDGRHTKSVHIKVMHCSVLPSPCTERRGNVECNNHQKQRKKKRYHFIGHDATKVAFNSFSSNTVPHELYSLCVCVCVDGEDKKNAWQSTKSLTTYELSSSAYKDCDTAGENSWQSPDWWNT